MLNRRLFLPAILMIMLGVSACDATKVTLIAHNLAAAIRHAIDNPEACRWLQEAYALRQYLPNQGKELEEYIEQACKDS